MVTVPDFVGTSTIDASKAADLIGLTVAMSDGSGSGSQFLEGVVTKQSPAAGTSVERSSRVELVVASKTVTVPTLVGTTLTSALTTLNTAQLRLGQTTSREVTDAKPGTIVAQSQAAGASVAAGTSVDVAVAVAPATTTVPNVVGMDLRSAQALLARAQLTIRVAQAQTRDIPSGRIVSQEPAAGVRVKRGAVVQVRLGAAAR
jgi:serine/threonine-protein kinase